MNKFSFRILAILFVTTYLASCHKSDLPTDESLIDCENCTFTYQENDGSKIVFSFREYWQGKKNSYGPYRGLLFEVPSGSTAFDYGKEDIASDKVNYGVMCVNCNVVPFQPVDGKIIGKKVNSNNWLVEANVILQASNSDTRDTITFKQYFIKVPKLNPNP